MPRSLSTSAVAGSLATPASARGGGDGMDRPPLPPMPPLLRSASAPLAPMADRGRLNEVLARPSPAVLDTSVGAHSDDRSPTGREFNGALKLAENNLKDAECDEAPPPYFLRWWDEEE